MQTPQSLAHSKHAMHVNYDDDDVISVGVMGAKRKEWPILFGKEAEDRLHKDGVTLV